MEGLKTEAWPLCWLPRRLVYVRHVRILDSKKKSLACLPAVAAAGVQVTMRGSHDVMPRVGAYVVRLLVEMTRTALALGGRVGAH